MSVHSAVIYAIKTGRLVRKPREVCGRKEVHAHHDDYSKPLAVRWLCHPHHMEHHRLEAARSQQVRKDEPTIGVYEFCRRTCQDITCTYELIYAGKIAGARKQGRKWLIPETSVAAWQRETEVA